MSIIASPPPRSLPRSVALWVLRILVLVGLGHLAFFLDVGVALWAWVIVGPDTTPPAAAAVLNATLAMYDCLAVILALSVLTVRRPRRIVALADMLLYAAAIGAATPAFVVIGPFDQAPVLYLETALIGVLLAAYCLLWLRGTR
jgi:hypothetical protein